MSAPDEVTKPDHRSPIEQLIADVGAMHGDIRSVLSSSERAEATAARAAECSARAEAAAERAANETMRLRVRVQQHDDWIANFDRRYVWLPLATSFAAFAISIAALVLAALPR